nr:unnamed protein product [Callosobruchus analis]
MTVDKTAVAAAVVNAEHQADFAADVWEKTRVDGAHALNWNAVPTICSFSELRISGKLLPAVDTVVDQEGQPSSSSPNVENNLDCIFVVCVLLKKGFSTQNLHEKKTLSSLYWAYRIYIDEEEQQMSSRRSSNQKWITLNHSPILENDVGKTQGQLHKYPWKPIRKKMRSY